MCTVELAWFVGLFEGEGCFVFHKEAPKRLSISLTDLDVLERVQEFAGGNISLLRQRQVHWKEAWVWTIGGENSVELSKRMLPLLGNRRASRCEEYINNFKTMSLRRETERARKLALIQEVTTLRDSGLTHKAIASIVSKERSYVTRLLN